MASGIARLGRRLAVLLCGLSAAGPTLADGAVYRLQGTKNTVYVAGSIHLLTADAAALPADMLQAYDDAEHLVMEIDMDDIDQQAVARFMSEQGHLPPARSLRDVIGAAAYVQLGRTSAQLGIPVEALDGLEPWVVALTIAQLSLLHAGFDPNAGVERQLAVLASRDGKDISGLETAEQQLSLLDALPARVQARFLQLTLAESDEIAGEASALIAAWQSGDLGRLEKLLLQEYKEFPELYAPLVRERNQRWIPAIRELLTRDDDYLVVVGALHLVGDDGLVRLMQRDGLAPQLMHQ
ncbi:MAG: TraB/GumN family protein [Steroidobacteraceae bacterium]